MATTDSGPGPRPGLESGTPEPALYRLMIDWTARLAREGPLLERLFAPGSGPRLLDLGSATGEHDRWLGARGARVVGVDGSAAMIAAAREAASDDPRLGYVEGDIAALPATVTGPFDGALCLGNTLVHLLEPARLEAFFAGVAARLRPGGTLLVQVLNYEAIVAERRRALAPIVRADGDGELVFLRLLAYPEPAVVEFTSLVLRRRPGQPTVIVGERSSRVRAWTRPELVAAGEAALGPVECFGDMTGSPYDPARSTDLVLIARRRPA